jgi:hypothetical protein
VTIEEPNGPPQAVVVVDMEARLVCCNARFRREWLADAPPGREDPREVLTAVRKLEKSGAQGRELFFPLWGRALCYAVVSVPADS